jgi:hypothetical protein
MSETLIRHVLHNADHDQQREHIHTHIQTHRSTCKYPIPHKKETLRTVQKMQGTYTHSNMTSCNYTNTMIRGQKTPVKSYHTVGRYTNNFSVQLLKLAVLVTESGNLCKYSQTISGTWTSSDMQCRKSWACSRVYSSQGKMQVQCTS